MLLINHNRNILCFFHLRAGNCRLMINARKKVVKKLL
jgi:hypothetical protein